MCLCVAVSCVLCVLQGLVGVGVAVSCVWGRDMSIRGRDVSYLCVLQGLACVRIAVRCVCCRVLRVCALQCAACVSCTVMCAYVVVFHVRALQFMCKLQFRVCVTAL